ncbi:hypothetical protein HanRHA438_Chr09g0401971 [Helianthus annuus]|nr:hypothetical protein HanHA300_Chr09g0320441 [Helianthus annuus]KAJ0534544.1 hypothetical protein HanIR_Chr09g0420981 [Helianthus annuus]KAJ0707634.1 hypothetical protein HanLR1_Chr09g0320681 [Helianthus annuus]KAJ0753590.1 hypothetical protein HanPI659440_Chr09g0337491 [Helianthus annuus]KAJ0888432.1 hypothetical protein HanRHA438_Chr09g0401971 [Helianthus annuus]
MTSCDELKDELLEQVYHENCPGCKVERQKQTQTGLPIIQLVYIWIVVLCVGKYIIHVFIWLFGRL